MAMRVLIPAENIKPVDIGLAKADEGLLEAGDLYRYIGAVLRGIGR